jgi:alkylation response protein AidB-like acyl-CoA dehydrogenase
MDLTDSPAEAEFRARLRTWLADNLPNEAEPHELAKRWEYMKSFQQSLYAGGWVALSYPKEFGGQGLGMLEEAILNQELARANAPSILPLGHLGRPFLTHASVAQRERYLPKLLSLEEVWCQGFSEPQAGSDLANLRTRAVKDGDGYRIDGQKLWTSYGIFADYCLLLARTDPDVPRHKGISAFIVPLDTPGVDVRPVVLANGDEEFAEVFFDGAWLPEENLLGQPGDGWAVAMATIAHERGAVDTGYFPKFERFLNELAGGIAATDGGPEAATVEMIGHLAAHLEVFGMHTLRQLSRRATGAELGAESSIDKLLMTHVEQTLLSAALELSVDFSDPQLSEWFNRYLYARSASIYGGTSQIQKNILATRILGLPR